MGSPVRDTQRKKLYTAERFLQYPKEGGRAAVRIETVPEIQAWVDRMIASAWWQKRYPHVQRITVKDGRGRRIACAGYRSITLPKWSRSKAVILHEIAHVVTSSRVAWHGWEFADNLLKLVGHWVGGEEAELLKQSFKKHRVRWKAPRVKRELSPEQLEVLRTRMARVRAAKEQTAA